jgi:radical SAM superfamily enzyme YgiQ (UPF0313 family)
VKVLFSNPPWWDVSEQYLRCGVRAGSRWPFTMPANSMPGEFKFGGYLPYPFFLGYAATYAAANTTAEIRFRDSIALRETYQTYADYLAVGKFDIVVIETATPSWQHDAQVVQMIHNVLPKAKIVIAGPITTTKSDEILATLPVHACLRGEYEKNAVKVIEGASGVIDFDLLTLAEMNAAPPPYMDAEIAHRYFDYNPIGQQYPHAHVWSSRGCPYKCLAGDTLVNTVEGMVPIRDLVGRTDVGVFTYDREAKRAKISTPRVIAKTGENQKLVRVHFDDGSHIDCTPDHRFVAFKWGNQYVAEREWLVEAKELTAGTRVRALRQYKSGEYLDTVWARRGREKTHRLVAEWKIGRRLEPGEVVHHIDHDKHNWHPDNLAVMRDTVEHFASHPEIAERMRLYNPAAGGLSPEWVAKIAAGNRGKVRSPESRERYRLAALRREASKTFEEKSDRALRGIATRRARGDTLGNAAHAPDGTFNHKVVAVEELPGLHDTYCMEVPDTGVFYANNVLVKNCCFCVWPAAMTGNDPDGTNVRKVRHYSPEYMEPYLTGLVRDYGYQSIYFDDDTFNLGNSHVVKMCEVMRKVGVPWSAMCRADTSKMETWSLMKESGCFGVKLGFESGNQYVVDKIVNKHLDLEYAREVVHELKRIGMTVHGTFTVGLPGETREQMQDTVRFIESLPLDSHQLSGTAEIEGTPLHTLRTAGHLDAYEGASLDADSEMHTDGNKRFAQLAEELRNS